MPRGDDGAVVLVVERRAAEVDQPHVAPLHAQQVVALRIMKIKLSSHFSFLLLSKNEILNSALVGLLDFVFILACYTGFVVVGKRITQGLVN